VRAKDAVKQNLDFSDTKPAPGARTAPLSYHAENQSVNDVLLEKWTKLARKRKG
jgi:hypothetical protein